jgi:predicted DNA-binding antitoxin AbrB/MazE fold protein
MEQGESGWSLTAGSRRGPNCQKSLPSVESQENHRLEPGEIVMYLEVAATYEDGVLKPDEPLPLNEHQRVTVRIEPRRSGIADSAGLIPFQGSAEALQYLLGPENQPWEKP